MSLETLLSSKKHDWRTPGAVLDRVRGLGIIGLDPCADDEKSHHFAAINVTEAEDGLSHDWAAYGDAIIFVNPPYGNALNEWVEMCCDFGEDGAEIVLLAPSRTDTRWFRKATSSADGRVLWHGRITFEGADNSAPFPSACWYWGSDPWLFCSVFADVGEVAVLR